MKKILIVMSISGVGGTCKSFIEFLKVFPIKTYEVHIILFESDSPFMSQIPQGVCIHKLPSLSNKRKFLFMLKSFHLIDSLSFLLLWVYGKLFNDYTWFYKNKFRDIPRINEIFDLAISYRGKPGDFVYFLCNKVCAEVKCIWVHEDVAIKQDRIIYKMVERLYPCLDKIFVVSEEAKQHFDTVFPKMKKITEVFHNVIPVETVLEMAKEGNTFSDICNGKRILTVGRFHHQKGFLLAIKALKLLLEKGYDVNWYFIGGVIGNNYYKQCCELINKEGVADHIIFLDIQMNPYKFMQDCDVYVQPSLFESFCITLAEALCFGNPIVTTCFCGAREQMKDRRNGYITEMKPGDLADGIEKALNDIKISVFPKQRKTDMEKLLSLIS